MEEKIFKLLRENHVGHAKAWYLTHEIIALADASKQESSCNKPAVISSRLSELEEENRKLKLIIENGLGAKDWENDCL